MQIEKKHPNLCVQCNTKTSTTKQYSVLSGEYFYIATCENNHSKEYLVEFIEVCPICRSPPLLACNCIQQTKTCANRHSWMKCRKCKNITISRKGRHIVKCDKYKPCRGENAIIHIWKKIINTLSFHYHY